jgi:hypothetical protein
MTLKDEILRFHMRYHPIEVLIDRIHWTYKPGVRKLLEENRKLFEETPGSSHNHQAWPGGYIDHVTETLNIAIYLYFCLDQVRPMTFDLSDALLVLFLHDLEKPWRDQWATTAIPFDAKVRRELWRKGRIAEAFGKLYSQCFPPSIHNALDYVEGEKDDYSPRFRAMNELAAFCHMCDIASARLWHDRPLEHGESWGQRTRLFRPGSQDGKATDCNPVNT